MKIQRQSNTSLTLTLLCGLLGLGGLDVVTGVDVCRDDYPNCCASQDYNANENTGTIPCNTMIKEDLATWVSGSSHTLTCQHGDAAAATECTWRTASGTTCRYTHYLEFKESCDDNTVSFTGDISGNKGLCQIRISSADQDEHKGRWTCEYQNYRDVIYVEVSKGR